ncbi:fructosamine kinase, partial [Streptomyces sp. SID5789]|nr:fructosamine kinase [Streptomyces sp. SID5789]
MAAVGSDSSYSDVAARFTGRPATAERRLSGSLGEVVLDDGRTVVVKVVDGPGAVRAEAAGLRWLAAAGAARVPVVHGHDERRLVVDRVAQGPPGVAAADRFGRE